MIRLQALIVGMLFFSLFVVSGSAQPPVIGPYDDVDTNGLVIEATAGWDGVVDKSNTAVPISLLLSNFSQEAIQGDLFLTEQYGRQREFSLGEIFISSNGTRRFTSLQNLWDWQDCVISIRDGDKVLWRRQLALNTGKTFFPSTNFALVIDAAERKLALPGAVQISANVSSNLQVAPKKGRPIQCITVKDWQVPNHCGPMTNAQAVVIANELVPDSLNRLQWKAIADFVCQGGNLFLPANADEMKSKLRDASPLPDIDAIQEDLLSARSLGLGKVYEYEAALFSSEGSETRKAIATLLANSRKQHLGSFLRNANFPMRQRQANRSYSFIFGLFALYTLLSGVVMLILFRSSRQQVTIYIASVVVGASIFAAVIGGILKVTSGDLNWMSITEVRDGQAFQMAKFQVKSAGSRAERLVATGNRPDVQYSGINRWNHYWDDSYTTWLPFAWKGNTNKEDSSKFAINIPITPFGQRTLQAADYKSNVSGFDFKIEFDQQRFAADKLNPPTNQTNGRNRNPASYEIKARLRINVKNQTPYKIRGCRVWIGATGFAKKASVQNGSRNYYNNPPPSGLVDIYGSTDLRDLAPGQKLSREVMVDFRHYRVKWNMRLHMHNGSLVLPRIPRLGQATAWIVAELEQSPILSIEHDSDFVPQEGYHLLVQEIDANDMPDLGVFYKSLQQESKQSDP